MQQIFLITMKGIYRDRLYMGFLFIAILFFLIPPASTFSLRQVAALATTLSLSLTSFILLLIAVFLGGTSLWKDIERQYVFSALGMPITRSQYILGKFLGIAGFLFLTAMILGILSYGAVWSAAAAYPPYRAIGWSTIGVSIFFTCLKYCLLVAVAFTLSTVSTSFFLPVFGTIAVFLAGSSSQEVFEYIISSEGAVLSPLTIYTAKIFYYLLPNFSAFDFSTNAVYSLPLDAYGLFLVLGYGVAYTTILLSIACFVFSKRDLQ